jgi:hypothetical protein
MFRPTPDELAALFKGQEVLEKRELTGNNYWSQVRRRPIATNLRHLARFFVPFVGWRAWTRSMRKLYWLFNPYKVSAVMGRKVGQTTISAASSA